MKTGDFVLVELPSKKQKKPPQPRSYIKDKAVKKIGIMTCLDIDPNRVKKWRDATVIVPITNQNKVSKITP